uniref:G_PROTEIN_RECEP_F1_2 domain-containing protein n=1 Tax=Rhabditophanes sp. KR3021 TaxID=114890 RepID=A0AC35TYU1_9BILA
MLSGLRIIIMLLALVIPFNFLLTYLTILINQRKFEANATMPIAEETIVTWNFSDQPMVIALPPPPSMPSTKVVYITLFLMVCIVVSFAGHISQLVLILYTKKHNFSINEFYSRDTKVFVVSLHVILFLYAVSLPLTVLERIVGCWIFGRVICMIEQSLMTLIKISTPWYLLFIIRNQMKCYTDCLIAQNTSSTSENKNRCSKYSSLIHTFAILVLVCGSIMGPLMFYTGVNKQVLHSNYIENVLVEIRTMRCVAALPLPYFVPMHMYSLFIEFLIPLFGSCTYLIIWHLRLKKYGSTGTKKNINFTAIFNSLWILVSLIFVTYTPHWIAMVLIMFTEDDKADIISENVELIIAEIAQLNPPIMCAISWLPLNFLSHYASGITNVNTPVNSNIRNTRIPRNQSLIRESANFQRTYRSISSMTIKTFNREKGLSWEKSKIINGKRGSFKNCPKCAV